MVILGNCFSVRINFVFKGKFMSNIRGNVIVVLL